MHTTANNVQFHNAFYFRIITYDSVYFLFCLLQMKHKKITRTHKNVHVFRNIITLNELHNQY